MNETQQMISDSLHRLLSERVDASVREAAERGDWPRDLWQLIEDAGFADVLAADLSEGADWASASCVFRAIGYHRVPLPLAETLLARWLARCAGLPEISGVSTVLEHWRDEEWTPSIREGQLILNGSAKRVPWARAARWLVVSAGVDGRQVIGLVDLSKSAVVVEKGEGVAGEPRDRIAFTDCTCSAHAFPERWQPQPVLVLGALIRAAQMAGALAFLLEQSVRYAGEREQFGRPLAKFQAIQQMLAVLASELSAAQTAVDHACASASLDAGRFEVAVAKVRVGKAASQGAAIAHQVHGAMGFTYEHPLHFASRRVWGWRAEYGSESLWAAEIGKEAISRGGDALWAWVTSRV